MARPALIVGLGGTGVKVLTLVKQELLATHGGQVPPEVQLLAFDTVPGVQAGGAAAATATGTATAVKLEKERGEYIWLGGNIRDYVRDVARGKYPHVSSWFQAAYYLDTLPDGLFYLEAGAGMLRQFSRLAIFYDVLKGAGLSKIYRMTRQAIERMLWARETEAIQVMLVSSVVGGTGAGMFVDMAYLIRQIAHLELRVPVTLRGFLVMPEAFSTIPSGVTPDMRARAYAAIREIHRFMVEPNWEDGYPMYYHGTERRADGDDVWQGHAKSKIFDFLYLIDGRRWKNRLDTVDLELGVAPTIADVIAAMLDEEGSRTFDQHKINLNFTVQNVGRTAFYGTVGTYTFVLPMYHITEDFAHRLTLEVLDELLGLGGGYGERDRDGVPIRLPSDRNAEAGEGRAGREDALGLLKKDLVRSLQDSSVEVQATTLTREVGRVASQALSETRDQMRGELAGRDLDTWLHFFEPPYAEVEATRREVQAVLQRRVEDVVLTSDKLHEKPVDGLRRIEENVKAYKSQHLGAEREGGRREGGDFRRALEKYRDIHLETFRKMLAIHCNNILNGRSTEDFREARGGKIGYLVDFLDGLAKQLDTFLVLVEEAREVREGQGERGSALEGARAALETMKQQASSWIPGQAVRAQRRYLEAEQYLVDILRHGVLEQLVIDTVRAMREYTQGSRDQAQAWANALGIGRASLYVGILDGRKQLASNRVEAEKIRVRRFIRDPEYEDALYTEYAQTRADRVNEMLRDLVWQAETKQAGMRHEFALGLATMTYEDSRVVLRPLNPDDRKRNLDALLERAREAFAEAWQRESVLKYLRSKYEATELGRELFDNGGPLLRVEAVPEGQTIVLANYLRAAYGEVPGEEAYLTDVIRYVYALSGADERFVKIVRSTDRFECGLVYVWDLIPIEGTRSYQDAEVAYLEWEGTGTLSGSKREILHVFPAEVNAVRYESRAVTELKQRPRVFADKVVALLEYSELLSLFVEAYAQGLITEQVDKIRHRFYALYSVGRSLSQYIELTTHSDPVTLLDAAYGFIYARRDARPDHAAYVDFDDVKRALVRVTDSRDTEEQVLMYEQFLQEEVLPLEEAEDIALRDFGAVVRLVVGDLIAHLRVVSRIGLRSRRFFDLWDDPGASDFDDRIRSFVRHLCDLTGLSPHTSEVEYGKKQLIVIGIGEAFDDIPRFPGVLPFVFLRQIHPPSPDDVEDVRRMLAEAVRPSSQIAILVTFGDTEVLQKTRDLLARERRTYALDIIAPSRAELFDIVTSPNPRRSLRQMVLSQVNLTFVSPFVTTGPVPDSMFFGRESVLRAITERADTASHAIIGGRRIGKTSILHRLYRVRLPAYGFRPLFHDCEVTSTEDAFLEAVAKAWLSQNAQVPPSFVDLIGQLPDDRPLVILLDEADKLVPLESATGYPLFRAFRALAQSGRCQFVLAGERTLREAMADPRGPLFNFANEHLIGLLDFSATEELVTRPLKLLEVRIENQIGIVRRIYDFTSGHPNVVQRLCQRLIARLAERGDRYLTAADIEVVIEDPGFQRDDFLSTYWEAATSLEKIISLLMADNESVRTLRTVRQSLAERCNLRPKAREVDDALQRLVDLRSILKRTPTGYEFAVEAFPRVVAGTMTLDDMLEVLAEDYAEEQAKGEA